MNKIYTLVRPITEWEESTITYAAFSTKEDAENARQEIIDFWNKIKEAVSPKPKETPRYDVNFVDLDNYRERWYDWFMKLTNPVGRDWPYNSEGVYDSDLHSDPECYVEIVELPLY
jgi:hypothetical protein